MNDTLRKSVAGFVAGTMFSLALGAMPSALPAEVRDGRQPLRVVVGIAPVAYLVEQVGGDRVGVEVLAASGVCSHQLSLSPKQAQALAKADLLLTIGMPFEQQLSERLRQTGSKVVCFDVSPAAKDLSSPSVSGNRTTPDGASATPTGASPAVAAPGTACPHGCDHDHEAASRESSAKANREGGAERADASRASAPHAADRPARPVAENHSEEAAHGHGCGDPNCRDHDFDGRAADPHIWLDPASLPRLAENIAKVLADADPAGASQFRRNQEVLQRQIAEMTKRLDEQLRPLAGQSIYVYHPSLGYLCKAYGLRQIAVEHDGKSPSAKHLRSLIQQARAERVRAVFVEPSGDQRAAAAVAQAIGAKLVVFDPLAPDVLTNLAEAAEQICRHQTD